MYNRKYGFELEFTNRYVSYRDMKRFFTESVAEHQPDKRVLNSETFRAWTTKNEHCGMEITSPALESSAESMSMIKNIIDTVRNKTRSIGRVVNRECGLHVHVDIGEFNTEQIRNLCRIFYNFEGVLFQLQPRSRRNNNYIRPMVEHGTDWINTFDPDIYNSDRRNADFMFDHSCSVNFGRFCDRGTVEFRYGAGTIRGAKVVGWIRLLLTLVEIAEANLENPINQSESIEDLKDFIRGNETNCKWIENQKSRCCNWITRRANELRESNERNEIRRRRNRYA